MASSHSHGAPAAPNDPQKDINAKATFTWVATWTVILFVGLWVLLVIFDRVLFEEQSRKVEGKANTEITELRQKEELFLSGKWEEGFPRKSIEQVMQEMARK